MLYNDNICDDTLKHIVLKFKDNLGSSIPRLLGDNKEAYQPNNTTLNYSIRVSDEQEMTTLDNGHCVECTKKFCNIPSPPITEFGFNCYEAKSSNGDTPVYQGRLNPDQIKDFENFLGSVNNDDFASTLVSWYISGFYTGYYAALKHGKPT
ncbi:uncharacterized protein CMU_014410 [Cryptosporidium muris RN66]|uniref:Uncharacterized protein n=1 Tax=Cryptosporidium muris (strain RN66) TaxID=441375 RepID=B6AEZ8_CRYMR|nr:uncharacterized protein CMU_014410 [Cryptosporidium muris RN66]EEA06765.1 hypothetical protein CMU_014410 [Cryptosporidium muris RN66]|eukprot:XP_002141114.1 hypothetical protein [Cryptosporidium muris RN66]